MSQQHSACPARRSRCGGAAGRLWTAAGPAAPGGSAPGATAGNQTRSARNSGAGTAATSSNPGWTLAGYSPFSFPCTFLPQFSSPSCSATAKSGAGVLGRSPQQALPMDRDSPRPAPRLPPARAEHPPLHSEPATPTATGAPVNLRSEQDVTPMDNATSFILLLCNVTKKIFLLTC